MVLGRLINIIAISGIFSKNDDDLDILPPPPPFPEIGKEKEGVKEEKLRKQKGMIKKKTIHGSFHDLGLAEDEKERKELEMQILQYKKREELKKGEGESKAKKKNVFDFFHKLDLVKTKKEKGDYRKQKWEEQRAFEKKKKQEGKKQKNLENRKEERRKQMLYAEMERELERIKQEDGRKREKELEEKRKLAEKKGKEKSKAKKKNVFDFFHKLDLVKTKKEKGDYRKQKQKEITQRGLEKNRREEERRRFEEEKIKRRMEELRQRGLEKKAKDEEREKAEEEKKKLQLEAEKQKELEKKRHEDERRKAEEEKRKCRLVAEKKRQHELEKRRKIEEERRKQKLYAERQRELEKIKQEDERKREEELEEKRKLAEKKGKEKLQKPKSTIFGKNFIRKDKTELDKEPKDIEKITPKLLKDKKKSGKLKMEMPELISLKGEKFEEEIIKPKEVLKAEEEIQKAIRRMKMPKRSSIIKGLFKKRKPARESVEIPKAMPKVDERIETPEVMPRTYDKIDNVQLIEERIHKARLALMDFRFDDSKRIYIGIMRMYNSLEAKDKSKVYQEIMDLYYERKSAEKFAK